jgi:hypothetical protein
MHTHDDPDPIVASPHRTPKVEAPSSATVARSADGAGADARSMLELQRLAGNASVSRLVSREAATEDAQESDGQSPVLDVVGRGRGEPLAPELRSEMEGRLGADFGGVRVHRDAAASDSARAVDAHAYTVGNDVVFRSDRWDPSSSEGKHTLAHELSHVVQQANGPVDGSPSAGGIRVSSPNDGFEQAADRSADAALARPTRVGGASAVAGAGPAGPSAQLEAAGPDEDELDEDQTVQQQTAQRQSNRDAPNRPAPDEEEEPEEEEPPQSAQREAASPEEELEEEPVAG